MLSSNRWLRRASGSLHCSIIVLVCFIFHLRGLRAPASVFFFTSKPAAPEIPPSATTFPAVTKAVMRGAQGNNPLFVSYFISLVSMNCSFALRKLSLTHTRVPAFIDVVAAKSLFVFVHVFVRY